MKEGQTKMRGWIEYMESYSLPSCLLEPSQQYTNNKAGLPRSLSQ